MKRKRRKFTDEFKDEAVKLVLEQAYPISEASRNLGIHANLLGRWKQDYEDGGKSGSEAGIKKTALICVGKAFANTDLKAVPKLYDRNFSHGTRNAQK